MNNELDIMLCKEILNDKKFNKKPSKTYCEHNRIKSPGKDCGGNIYVNTIGLNQDVKTVEVSLFVNTIK